MRSIIISLIFILFSPFAYAKSPSDQESAPLELKWPDSAKKIESAMKNLSPRDKIVIEKIAEASLSNDRVRIGYLMNKKSWKDIHDKEQKRFWAAVIYIAFNYANVVGCDTRNFWFLGKSRLIDGKSTLIKVSACKKQVQQNLSVGGINRSLHEEISTEYCEVFRETWTSIEKAALDYAKANSVASYLCK